MGEVCVEGACDVDCSLCGVDETCTQEGCSPLPCERDSDCQNGEWCLERDGENVCVSDGVQCVDCESTLSACGDFAGCLEWPNDGVFHCMRACTQVPSCPAGSICGPVEPYTTLYKEVFCVPTDECSEEPREQQ